MQRKVNASNHIISHKYASTIDTMFYHGETHTGENPINLSYEDSLIKRTSIHYDHVNQTLLYMRVYINRETEYLSFHVGHVTVASTLAVLEVLAKEALTSSS